MGKEELRKEVKLKRQSLDKDYFTVSNGIIFNKVIGLKEYAEAESIFAYVSKEDEVDTKDIIKDALNKGKKVFVPKCIDNTNMIACEIRSLADLKLGMFNILEPSGEEKHEKDFDLCIIPCVTCDRLGNRLGHGKGYYDRFLKSIKCIKVVLCYEDMIFNEVPHDESDIKMNVVISEKQVLY